MFMLSEPDSNQLPIMFYGHMNMKQNVFVQNTEGHKKYILFRNLRGEWLQTWLSTPNLAMLEKMDESM